MKEKLKNLFDRFQTSLSTYPKLFRRTELTDYAVFSLFSVIIGIAAGFSAVIFHNAIEFFNKVFFEQTKEGLFFLGSAAVILLPAIGMFIQALMIKFAPDESKRRGVYEVVKAVATKGGNIKFRTTLFHFFAPVISIGSGVTLGPEGPAAQLGGGVASKISTLLSIDDEKKRIFTAAGAGAAIAAIFNTPLAGVFFTLEIILLNDFHTPTFSALIISSVSASAISRIFLGNESVFVFKILEPINYSDLYLYAILGIFSGIISVIFIRFDEYTKKFFKSIYKKNFPQILAMLIVGLLIGIAGFFYKEIFGIGYFAINELLANKLALNIVVLIFILKFILVPLAANSGAFGGLFAPSLFLGASFGYLYQYLVMSFLGISLDPSTVILISMGAMLGGIHAVPITAILIIFEMTQDYSFILPLMLAVISATFLVQIILRENIHKKHLEAEGFIVDSKDIFSILSKIQVSDVELNTMLTIPKDYNLAQIVNKFLESADNILYVTDESGKLIGFINEKDLRPVLKDYEMLKNVLIATDVLNPDIIYVDSESTLNDALKLMMKNNLSEIPVIKKDGNNDVPAGTLSLELIQTVISKENLKQKIASGLADELRTLDTTSSIRVSDDYSIKELKVPLEIMGKTLSELKLRNKFNIEVLMIKKIKYSVEGKKDQIIITAEPNYKFESGDELVIFGKNENIQKFENTFK